MSFLGRTDGTVADKTIRSGFWAGSSNIATHTLAFINMIILARVLLPEDFGLMGIVLVYIKTLDVFTQPGLTAAIIHRKDDRILEAVDTVWGVFLARGLLLATLVYLTAPMVLAFYEESLLQPMIRVIAVVFIIQGLQNPHTIILRKEMNFKNLAVMEISAAIINSIVVISLAYIYHNVWVLVTGRLVLAAATTVGSYIVVRNRPRLSFKLDLIGELFKYGKFVTGGVIVASLTSNIDNAVAGKVIGMDELGYYVLAFTLATLPSTAISPLVMRVTFPAFSKLQTELVRLRAAYIKVLRLVATIVLPIAAGLAVLGSQFVIFIYGDQWVPMVSTLQVLCVFGAMKGLASTIEPVFRAIGKPDIAFYVAVTRLALICILIYPFSVQYGIIGTAASITIPTGISLLVLLVLTSKHLNYNDRRIILALAPSIIATAVMSSLVLVTKGALVDLMGNLGLAGSVLLGGLTYCALIAVLDRTLLIESMKYIRTMLR